MARFFKPLLGAVALAAATLTSTGAFAAYAYNAQISITAPKGSTAEAAAKDKTKPTGVKLSTCAAKITSVTPNIQNLDALTFTVKYDAGKDPAEIGDVYLVLENLAGTPSAPAFRYVVVSRNTGLTTGASSGLILATYASAAALYVGTDAPFLAAADNLGAGATSEVLFGGSLNLTGLDKGLWAMHLVIAKPGKTNTGNAALGATSFSLGHPETWAASDTVVFALGAQLPPDAVGVPVANAGMVEYNATATATNAGNTGAGIVCQ